jgi:hypothetical protein
MCGMPELVAGNVWTGSFQHLISAPAFIFMAERAFRAECCLPSVLALTKTAKSLTLKFVMPSPFLVAVIVRLLM